MRLSFTEGFNLSHITMSFFHEHPYAPFIPNLATKLIVGTIPPPRFSTGTLYQEDVDFCYGSKYGLLWPIFNDIFSLNLLFENSHEAINQRKMFLNEIGVGICDMVANCKRDKIDASDLGMKDIQLRDLLQILRKNTNITTLLFMGGNSKNGPEYLFRSHLRSHGLKMFAVSKTRPKIHQFSFDNRIIKTVSLISPSSAANRSIGGDPYYKFRKSQKRTYSTLDFRKEQYQIHFS